GAHVGGALPGGAARGGGRPPCSPPPATHVLMHSTKIYTAGPATSRPTWSAPLPQNEQRSLDCIRSGPAMTPSFRRMLLYPRFAPAQHQDGCSSLEIFQACSAATQLGSAWHSVTIGQQRSFHPPRP